MPQCCDAKLLQVVRRQIRQNSLVYLVVAECRLILPEAQAPQPPTDVHDGAPYSGLLHIIVPSGGCPGGPKRPRIGVFGVNRCHRQTVPRSVLTYRRAKQCRKLCQDQRGQSAGWGIGAEQCRFRAGPQPMKCAPVHSP